MANDRITLTVPAQERVRQDGPDDRGGARRAASGMTYDDVEDVRMAAEEAFVYASDTLRDGCRDHVRVHCSATTRSRSTCALGAEEPRSDEELERSVAYATFILESVCDEYEFASDENGAHLRLVKRAGSTDADLGVARRSRRASSRGTRSTPGSCSAGTASTATRRRATSSSRCTSTS